MNKFSKDIAVYNLFSRIRHRPRRTDQKTYLNRYNAAIKFLTLVAEGKVSYRHRDRTIRRGRGSYRICRQSQTPASIHAGRR